MANNQPVGAPDLLKTAELLLARRIQLVHSLEEINRAIESLEQQERRLRPGAKTAGQARHLDANYKRMVGSAVKLQAEVTGELTEVVGLLRALPLRQQRGRVDIKNVRALVRQSDLFKAAQTARLGIYASDLITKAAFCDNTCITSCTECVTSCTTDCVTSCTSDCVSACTACSPSDVTGCIDTLGMGSLFNKPEKTGDPIELGQLADRTQVEIEW
jgi:hypothetical protein